MDEPRELRSTAEELVERLDVEPRRRLREPNRCPVAAVRPVRGVPADAGFNRVPDDVEDCRDQIGVAIHLDGERPILEKVRLAPVPAICSARVVAVQHLESG